MTELLPSIAIALGKSVFMLSIVFGFAPLLVWAERRQSAMIQDRVGPHRAALRLFGRDFRFLGLLHPIADSIKMVWKEDFVPQGADKLLHTIAPVIALAPALFGLVVVPFGPELFATELGTILTRDPSGAACIATAAQGAISCASPAGAPTTVLQIATLDVGMLMLFAAGGLGVVGAALAGYASNNKYSLLGGMRAAGQMVSYEVALGLTLIGPLLVAGTLRPELAVRWQVDHLWLVLLQPQAALLYLAAAIAETKRVPFDVPEGESELVGGYFTEYSGMKFGMFFFAEYVEVIALAAVAATLFFGGWDVPGLADHGIDCFGFSQALPHGAVTLLRVGAFVTKVVVLIWFQLMIRWSLPRFRYDQVMKLCWRYLLPAALINIFVTAAILVWLRQS